MVLGVDLNAYLTQALRLTPNPSKAISMASRVLGKREQEREWKIGMGNRNGNLTGTCIIYCDH